MGLGVLTSEKWIGFDPELLSVTVHPEDEEAYTLWAEKSAFRKKESSVWKGTSGISAKPSGPNTEIFYDRGEKYGNDPSDSELYPGGENDRYLEVWNLVFSEFNHNPDGTYTPLPKKTLIRAWGLNGWSP